MAGTPRPLDGIFVLDLGQIYQGPYAGFLLAMAGATVVKIEPPAGEPLAAPRRGARRQRADGDAELQQEVRSRWT